MISSLSFNLNYAIGAHSCAERTADAGFHIGYFSHIVTFLVDFCFGNNKKMLGTSGNAQAASLTLFNVKS